jgi:hypothetical protein
VREAELLIVEYGDEYAFERSVIDAIAYAEQLPADDLARQWLNDYLQPSTPARAGATRRRGRAPQ